eukprot:528407-Alexandrium_andersonii.AAC.1
MRVAFLRCACVEADAGSKMADSPHMLYPVLHTHPRSLTDLLLPHVDPSSMCLRVSWVGLISQGPD